MVVSVLSLLVPSIHLHKLFREVILCIPLHILTSIYPVPIKLPKPFFPVPQKCSSVMVLLVPLSIYTSSLGRFCIISLCQHCLQYLPQVPKFLKPRLSCVPEYSMVSFWFSVQVTIFYIAHKSRSLYYQHSCYLSSSYMKKSYNILCYIEGGWYEITIQYSCLSFKRNFPVS